MSTLTTSETLIEMSPYPKNNSKLTHYSLNEHQNGIEKETFKLSDPIENIKFDDLSNFNIWSYGVGHFQNDITATTLLTYFPLFIKDIYPIHSINPGYWVGFVVLIGQTIDSLATPMIGYLSDKFETRIGKRKPWHIFGTFLTFIAFLFLLMPCHFCNLFSIDSDKNRILNYTIFFSIYNIGWAACQVTHMSLVPSLSVSRNRRDKLNNLRNSFTFISNFIALIIILYIFSVVNNSMDQFKIISEIIGVISLLVSMVFWFGLPEKTLVKKCENRARNIRKTIDSHFVGSFTENKDHIKKNDLLYVDLNQKNNLLSVTSMHEFIDNSFYIKYWLKKREFYQYGIVYMCVRLSYNSFQNLLSFYLIYTLKYEDSQSNKLSIYLAIFPLIIYIFSCLGSFYSEYFFLNYGRKKTYVFSTFLLMISALGIILTTHETTYLLYFIFPIYGIGQALNMNAGSGYIAEVIGQRGSQGAIVYGLYSFLDKIVNGFVFFTLFQSNYMQLNDPDFYRYMISCVPCFAIIIACLIVIFGKAADYNISTGKKNKLLDEFVE